MDLKIFSESDFLPALHTFFNKLNVPVHHIADEPTTAKMILKDTYKDNDTFKLTNDVYFVGMVDDAAFGNKKDSIELDKIKKDYDGILIFGVTLHKRPNGLLPTRSQLAEITRAFNREFYYTPVVIVFKYNNYIAFANTERLKYKQEWREGEKAGKVSLLRDVNIKQPHAGHHRILAELKIPTSGNKKVDSFAKLYAYWQEVLSVNILNKKFYDDLSKWYFWAVKNVQFPGAPTFEEAHVKGRDLEDLKQEHKATNVIRMLTRLLFVWFLKEKKLIPGELFDLKALQDDILNDIDPVKQNGLFKEQNIDSVYYKAILQNLFFATLNCPIEGDSIDKRKRGFRLTNSNYGTMFLMRYEKYFKDKDGFLEMMNKTVPFLNGGLFECLDERGEGEKKDERKWVDGFSDNLPKEEHLVVPDYLFFGKEEHTDLSDVVGINTSEFKEADVKGLIKILESYKFTITENTPIEEDVALDPELLGRVFENLLASYNPETKTTARKQTGSFYTPREIVNYMVDESLIAYLDNAIDSKRIKAVEPTQEPTETWRQLISFDPGNPFSEDKALTKDIITALSTCTILDPACGSGAFPMGILQKMVHILQKLDPSNEMWQEVQFERADEESKNVFGQIEDEEGRQERLDEIYQAFDQTLNDPDYARKLFLIENCIFGVDIQPIATQISKLRFFISLVVDQKVNPEKNNFGIRALPNLETKFVAANTLIGIDELKAGDQTSIFRTEKLKELEAELKIVRSKLFSAKSRPTKVKHRNRDEELRNEISAELIEIGWESDTAQKLASWDPYDQNASSNFFDKEWMFDIKEGFDVVIGNPPYKVLSSKEPLLETYKLKYPTTKGGKVNLYKVFIEKGVSLLKYSGVLSYITPYNYLTSRDSYELRNLIVNHTQIIEIIDYEEDQRVFENVTQAVATLVLLKGFKDSYSYKYYKNNELFNVRIDNVRNNKKFLLKGTTKPITEIQKHPKVFTDYIIGFQGEINVSTQKEHFTSKETNNSLPLVRGNHIGPYKLDSYPEEYCSVNVSNRKHHKSERIVFQEISNSGLKKRVNAVMLNNILCGHTTNYIIPKREQLKWFFLGLMNSSLINYYFKFFNQTNHVPIGEIKDIPIPNIEKSIQTEIIGILSFLLSFKIDTIILEVVDALVFEFYFSEHMKKHNINIFAFIESDINKMLKGRGFIKLNKEEKEIIIKQLHNTWSDPNNEVVKRMSMFREKSPDLLGVILDS